MKSAIPCRSERTRRFIIETAAPIFNKKGYAGTSMSDLTTATGLTKGSIYGNFKDKNDVAVNVFQHNIDLIFDFFAKELGEAGTPLEKLLAYPRGFRKIYRMVLSHGGCPIMNTAVEADDTHATLRRMAMDVFSRWKKGITALIEQGRTEGSLAVVASPSSFAEVLIALMEGGMALSKVTGEASYFLSTLDTAEKMIADLARPSGAE